MTTYARTPSLRTLAACARPALALALSTALVGPAHAEPARFAADAPGPAGLGAPAPAPASADRPRSVAVFVLSGEQVGTPISELYAAARRGIEAETALEVAPFEVFPPSMRETAVRECAGNGACFAKKVREAAVEVDLLLLVSADRIGDGVLLGLRLVDLRVAARGGNPNLATVGEQLPEGISLIRAMRDYLAQVFPRDLWGQVASLRVEVDQPNAEVVVGAKTCVAPCALERLPPGDYELLVRKAGYIDHRAALTLASRQQEVVQVTLVGESGGLTSSPWFWGAIGVGVVGAAVTSILIATSAGGRQTICIGATIEDCKN
jgi:hypothetical protein